MTVHDRTRLTGWLLPSFFLPEKPYIIKYFNFIRYALELHGAIFDVFSKLANSQRGKC